MAVDASEDIDIPSTVSTTMKAATKATMIPHNATRTALFVDIHQLYEQLAS
jgi:hypothetical protein